MSAYRIFYALCVITLVALPFSNKQEVSKDDAAPQLEAVSSDSTQSSLHSKSNSSLGIAARPSYRSIPQSSPIEIDWKALKRVRVEGKGLLEFNSPLKNFSTRIATVSENRVGGYSISGNIDGEPSSKFLGTVYDDAFVASVTSESTIHERLAIAKNASGIHEIQKLVPDHTPICEGIIKPPMALSLEDPEILSDEVDEGPPLSADEVPDEEGNTVIDVMVVYTEEAKNNRGGASAMSAAANQAVNWANIAFDNSDIDLSFRLVHVAEIAYNDSGSSNTDLRNLQDTSVIPEVHELRDAYGADIVSLWTNGDYGGLGNLGALNQWTDGRYAFNVCSSSTQFGSSKIYGIFTHECGHNLGCGHARDQDEEAGPSDTFREYGAGWRWTDGANNQWRTLMTYRPGEKIQHFSNPDVNYNGLPTGTETSNNARVIKEMMSQVANYRDSVLFEFEEEGDLVTITNYNELASGVVTIPSRIKGKPVTQIGPNAFKDCKRITRVVIPESVTLIREYAFVGCSLLTDIEFLGDAPTIGVSVFAELSPTIWITYPPDAEGYSNPFNGVRAKPLGAEAPNFTAQDFEVTEQSLIGTEVGVLVATDGDDDTLSFSIVESDDPDGDEVPPFSISGNRLVVNDTSDLDFEFGESIALTVQVTDGVFNVEAPITVNLNELESQIALSRVYIPQNTVGFSLVGTLSTPDSESENLTYRLVNAKDPELSELILFSDEWLYLDDGSDQGVAWRATDFNDEEWFSGDSPLGYGLFGDRSPLTLISFGDDSDNKYPTTYFRNVFNIEDPLLVESLVLNLEVDDGAIVYINGNEVLRFRADAIGDHNDYASLAIGGVDEVVSQFELTEGIGSILQKGFNVIAVEVHQANGTSSDSWLNLSMSAKLRIPGLSDSDHFYLTGDQLFINKSVTEAGRAEGDSFTVPVVSIDDLGNEFSGQVSIAVGPNSKSPPDSIILSSQELLEQQASGQVIGQLSGRDPEGDTITFAVFPNPDYLDNQFFTINGNELVTITSVDFDEVSEFLILITAVDSTGLQYSEEFSIDVLRFEEPPTDIVLQPNLVGINAEDGDVIGTLQAIDPNEGQEHVFEIGPWPVEIGAPVIPFGSTWSFLDDGSDQGTAWRALNFDDAEWKVGVAELGYGDGDEATVVGFVDTDPLTAGVQKNATTYFRHIFEIDEASSEGYLFRIVYDDATLIHINGITVAGSQSLPDDTQFDTFSQVTSNDNELTVFINIPPGLINAGENIIAVEVHQANETSSDMSFDFELVPLIGVSYQDYFTVEDNELKVTGSISELGIEPPFTFEVPVTAIDPVAGSTTRFLSVILSSADSDNDGWDDDTEILFGSSPNDDESVPAFELIVNDVGAGGIEILFPGEQGVTYVIQQSNDLEEWLSLKKLIIGQGSTIEERFDISGEAVFFRIIKK